MARTSAGVGGSRAFIRHFKRSPLRVPDCLVWLDPHDENITFNGPDVAAYANKGSGGNITQITAAKQALWVANHLPFGGRPGLDFDGVNHYMQSASGAIASASQDVTAFAVLDSDLADASIRNIFGWTTPQNYLYWTWSSGGGKHGRLAGGAVADVAGSTPSTSAKILCWRVNSVAKTVEVFENGVSAGSQAFATNAALGGVFYFGSVGISFPFDGVIGESLIYPRLISDDEVSYLTTYLNQSTRIVG